jgi:dCTP deaminase
MLAGPDIAKAIGQHKLMIDPYDPGRLHESSYDVTLDKSFRYADPSVKEIDVAAVPENHTVLVHESMRNGEPVITLRPGEFVLACTQEIVTVDNAHSARVEGRSSLGRLGLLVHLTAGFIDPGFSGHITLELYNAAPWTIHLRPGMKIAQVCFFGMSRAVKTGYAERGNYAGQLGPTESRFKL